MIGKSDVLKKFADDIADSIVRKTIRELRGIQDTLSEEGGDLKNAWEEICAQVQYQDSYFWEAYEGVAWSIISRHVATLKRHELLALWFQTDEGENWDSSPIISRDHCEVRDEVKRDACHDRVEDAAPPLSTDEVERYLQHRLHVAAESFSNQRIEKFLENRA